MSATALRVEPQEAVDDDLPAPRRGLRAVASPEPAVGRRAPFAVFLALLLGGGLAGLLLLNTQLQQGSFALSDLQSNESRLSDQAQVLQQQADALGAPQAIESAAAALHMVPGTPQFLDLAKPSALPAPQVTALPVPPTAAQLEHARAVAAEKAARAKAAKAKAALALEKAKAAAAQRARAAAAAKARARATPAPTPSATR